MGMFKTGDHVRSLDPSTTPALEAIVGKVFADGFFTAESYPKGSMVKPGFHYHSPEYWELVEAAPPPPIVKVGTVYRANGTDNYFYVKSYDPAEKTCSLWILYGNDEPLPVNVPAAAVEAAEAYWEPVFEVGQRYKAVGAYVYIGGFDISAGRFECSGTRVAFEAPTFYRTAQQIGYNLQFGLWALDDPNEGVVYQARTSVPLIGFVPKEPKEAPCCDCKTVLPREKLQASPHGSLFCVYCSQRIRLECAHNINESNGECILCGAGPKWTQAPDDEVPWEGGLSFASRPPPEKPGPNEGACAWASSDWESDW